mgnify:CR=1 FL=1
MSFNENKTIKSSYKKLFENGGIIKLDSNQEERNKIKELVEEYPDLEYFEIESLEKKYLILRYRDIGNKINYHEKMVIVDKEFNHKNYKKCLGDYIYLLNCSIYPTSELYAKIGLCYYKLNYFDKAEDYLMVANYKENGNKDFNLEKNVNYFEEKVKKIHKERYNTRMLEKKNMSSKIEFNKIDEIVGYITSCDSDIESAGMEFNLSKEERDYIKLVFAIEFYKQGDIEKGNYYLNAVENSPNKSKKIVKFCEEVRNNKNFYQYRDDVEPKKLNFIRTGKRNREY